MFSLVIWSSKLDKVAETKINESITDAATIYATARVINATVSVIQETETQVEPPIPFVNSINLHVFQILDPINDIIERFSLVMTYALGSLGLQKLLVLIFENELFKVLITAILFITGIAVLFDSKIKWLLIKTTISLMLARISIGLVIILNAGISGLVIDDQIDDQEKQLNLISTKLNNLKQGSLSVNEGLTSEIASLEKTKANKQAGINILRKKLDGAKVDLNKADEDLQKLTIIDDCKWWKMFCSKSEKLLEAEQTLDAIQIKVKAYESSLSNEMDKLNEIDEEIECQKKRKSGGSCSVAEWVKTKADSINPDKLQNEIIDEQSGWFDDVISLMSLVILKAILLPIFFWISLFKVLKLIWKYDLKTFNYL